MRLFYLVFFMCIVHCESVNFCQEPFRVTTVRVFFRHANDLLVLTPSEWDSWPSLLQFSMGDLDGGSRALIPAHVRVLPRGESPVDRRIPELLNFV